MQRHVLATLVLIGSASVFAGAATAEAFRGPAARFSGPELIEKLRGGDLVVLIRHAATGHTPHTQAVLGDCTTQRVLSEQGRRQAEELGRAFRKMGILVGDIFTSPWCRAIQTAESAFGTHTLHRSSDVLALWDEQEPDDRRARVDALRAMLATKPRTRGTNTVLVTHSVNLQSLGLEIEPEGQAHVFQPGGGGFLGSIQPQEWRRVAGLEADRAEGSALVEKLVGGGYVVLMRHAATARGRAPAEVADVDACANQRVLSEDGLRQAEGVASSVQRLGIQVGDVLVSPYCRCVDTGRIAFGKATVSEFLTVWDALPTEEKVERSAKLRALINTPPAAGTNTVIITHSGALIWSLGLATEPEGIGHVFQPSDLGRAIHLGPIRPAEWKNAEARQAVGVR
jgi:phosphohistidine phosphatase SixA